MRSKDSTSQHTTQPPRGKNSEIRTRKERHIRSHQVPQSHQGQPESPHSTSQEVRYHSPVNRHPSSRHYSREPETRSSSSYRVPPSKPRHVPRSTPIPRAASHDGDRQNKDYDSRANYRPPTPRYSPKPERRPSSSDRAPRSKPRSPVPHSTPSLPVPSQNGKHRNNNPRSPSLPSSSEASDNSDGSGDTGHSEYIQGSDSDSSADCADYAVVCLDSAGNESDVSVVSAGTRRDEAASLLQEEAQLQAEAEHRAAALQAEYDEADERLGCIRAEIVRYMLKAESNNADFSFLARGMRALVAEEYILSLVSRRDEITWMLASQQHEVALIQVNFHSASLCGEGPEDLYKEN